MILLSRVASTSATQWQAANTSAASTEVFCFCRKHPVAKDQWTGKVPVFANCLTLQRAIEDRAGKLFHHRITRLVRVDPIIAELCSKRAIRRCECRIVVH